MQFLIALLFSVLGIVFSVPAEALVAVPPLKARVTDLTNTLNPSQRSALEQTLAEFEARKGSQIAVLVLPTTQPETTAQYAVRVYDEWKLGRKGIDDGVLVVVAKDDRRVWIATGRGVEGALPDAAVKRIVEDDITPRFKQGDFYGGIRAGVDRIMHTLEGEPLPPPRHAGQQSPLFQHVEWLIPAAIVLFVGGGILRAVFGRFFGSGLVGAFAAGVVWLVVGSILVSVLVGLFLFIIGLFGSASMRPRYGGWGGGGWSSGGGGGFGGGGGGFSGGGGSTSGGGAGGSW